MGTSYTSSSDPPWKRGTVESTETDSRSQRVLVVDDEESIRKIITKTCLTLGWEVDEAEDGLQGLDMMKRKPHDIYVLDQKMPGLSGLELAKRVTQHEEVPAILILTGFPEVDKAVDAIKTGVLDYAQKPIVPSRLKELLLRAAKYREGRLRALAVQREREKNLRDIKRANERFCAMLQFSLDAIFLLDMATGEIVDCNATAYEGLGYSQAELLGNRAETFVNLPAYGAWSELVNDISESGSIVAEGKLHSKNGMVHPVEVSLSPAYFSAGRFITAVVRDITKRKQTEAALETARGRAATEASTLRSIIEGMENGVVLVNEFNIVTQVNDGFLNLVRMPREMVVDNRLGAPCDGDKNCLQGILDSYKRRITYESKVANCKFKGRPISIRVQPIFQNEKYRGAIIALFDIKDIVEACERAEEGSRLKSEYLGRMAYEMRTQLEGIMGMTGLLCETDLNSEQRVLLKTAEECGKSLSNLVADIHKLSQIERQTQNLNPEVFDLPAAIHKAASMNREDSKKAGKAITACYADDLPIRVKGYGERLIQLLTVILEDAIRIFDGPVIVLSVGFEQLEKERILINFQISESEAMSSILDGPNSESLEWCQYPGAEPRTSLLESLVGIQDGSFWSERVEGDIRVLCARVNVENILGEEDADRKFEEEQNHL